MKMRATVTGKRESEITRAGAREKEREREQNDTRALARQCSGHIPHSAFCTTPHDTPTELAFRSVLSRAVPRAGLEICVRLAGRITCEWEVADASVCATHTFAPRGQFLSETNEVVQKMVEDRCAWSAHDFLQCGLLSHVAHRATFDSTFAAANASATFPAISP